MMEREFAADEIRYGEGPGWQACEIPYQGRELAMILLLPSREPGAWRSLQERLARDGLAGIRQPMRPRRVRVFLPRFRIESTARLDAALTALGLLRCSIRVEPTCPGSRDRGTCS